MELQVWRDILAPYELAVEELMVKFNHIKKEFKQAGLYSPIESVEGRVKSISSIIDKAARREMPLNEAINQFNDLAGIRIICQFEEDIERVIEIIRNRTDMKVLSEEDYIHKAKPSGYRSYHINAWYEVQTIKGNKAIMAEFQIRTLAMNFWATIEHSLRYKYGKEIPQTVADRLNATADATTVLDQAMSDIREDVVDAEGAFLHKESLVNDILSNIDNLYAGKAGNTAAVANIQQEFYRVYFTGNIEELEKFSKNLDKLAASRNIQNI